MLDSKLEAGEVRRRSGLPWRLPDPSTAAGPPGSASRCTTSPGPGSPRSPTRPPGSRGGAAPPGTATRILGADAYQAAGQPSQVFLSGPPSPGQPAAGSVRPGGILPGSGAMAGEKTT